MNRCHIGKAARVCAVCADHPDLGPRTELTLSATFGQDRPERRHIPSTTGAPDA